ncbi:MAG: hypothetical protein JRI77_18020 [Deltaproteobacteria bacterium]|nr:hypothetical protein [Deltaproteobacteria bacterium]
MAEYGQNILYLRGRIVKIQERMVGEAKDILLVTALLNIPNPRSSYIVEVEAFGKTAERIIAAVNEWVHLEGRLESREYEGKYYQRAKIFEVWIKPDKDSDSDVAENDESPLSEPPF